jgi:hypothetical protein
MFAGLQIGDGVPRGSVRRAPASVSMSEGSMSSGAPPRATAPLGASLPVARKAGYSSNPFSKSFTPAEASASALGSSRRPLQPASRPSAESMVSAMRLSDGDAPADESLRLPPASYPSAQPAVVVDPAVAAANSPSSFFSVPGLPTFSSATVVSLPSFAPPVVVSSRSKELSKEEEEDLMDSILNDTA